jgi:DNA-binding MarR family transcriptional regulator
LTAREDAQQVLESVRRLVRMLRVATRQAEQRSGTTAAQLFVLSQLAETPALSMSQLAERTLTDPSSVSTVVSRLVDAGLVVRRRAEDDHRCVELALTKRGRAIVAGAPELAQVKLVEAVESMSEAERRALVGSLRLLVERSGADRVPARMFFEDEHSGSSKRSRR